MENKTELLSKLFNEWEETIVGYKDKFVRDGIIDEQEYDSARKKILFITKEPNNPEQKPGDYSQWWKQGLQYGFSIRIAEWAYGILNDFPQYDDIDHESKCKAIRQIALLNIKKIGGAGVSDYNSMITHLKTNHDFLHRQIEIIKPNIIITGVSWPELLAALFPDITKWQSSGYGVKIGKYNDAKIIDYYHPSSRTAPAASYSLLQNIFSSKQFNAL